MAWRSREYDTTNASYNTFTKLQALINVLESGDWECGVMNCGNNAPYCSGAEQASVNLPATTAFVDVHQRFGWLVGGMPVARMWDKVFARAKNVAAANGVTMLNSSDVGGANHAQVLLPDGEVFQLAARDGVELRIVRTSRDPCLLGASPAQLGMGRQHRRQCAQQRGGASHRRCPGGFARLRLLSLRASGQS